MIWTACVSSCLCLRYQRGVRSILGAGGYSPPRCGDADVLFVAGCVLRPQLRFPCDDPQLPACSYPTRQAASRNVSVPEIHKSKNGELTICMDISFTSVQNSHFYYEIFSRCFFSAFVCSTLHVIQNFYLSLSEKNG